ncbi:MAG: hypothetical protein ACRDB0_04800 [Paraclostridium sp.]
MYTQTKRIDYLRYDIVTGKVVICTKIVKAKLDIKTMQSIKSELDMTVPNILESIKDFDVNVIFKILAKSIQNIEYMAESEILTIFNFKDALEFIMELLSNSMPKGEDKAESIFEDEEEMEEGLDWDFDYMFHLWTNVLKRSDNMWDLTPRTYFKQLKLVEEMNNKNNNEVVTEV